MSLLRRLGSMAPALARVIGARGLLARRYRGRGVIFHLHSVVPDGAFHPDARLRCPQGALDAAVRAVRSEGLDIIALDEVPARLDTPRAPPFAVFTFDDGYADMLTHALPVMARHGAPFTVFVCTGMPRGEIDAWWFGLAALIRRTDRIALPCLQRAVPCRDAAEKIAAFSMIEGLVRRSRDSLAALHEAIARAGIDIGAIAQREALTPDELARLAAHPLVTIGAHGVRHLPLAMLGDAAMRAEMIESRRDLEAILDRPVHHFAYPFGDAAACGAREEALAAALGFRTAVTTRRGGVFPAHRGALHALPREPLTRDDTVGSLRDKIDGLPRALVSRFGDPVARM